MKMDLIDVTDLLGEVRELLDAAHMAARDIDDRRKGGAMQRLLGHTSDLADTVANKLEALVQKAEEQGNA